MTARERLAPAIVDFNWFRWKTSPTPFEGWVDEFSVDIQRIILYRNSFLPQIRARLVASPSGSQLIGTMRLSVGVTIFLVFWFGFLSMSALAMLSRIRRGEQSSLSILVPIGMAVFAWALTASLFTYEARKARTILTALLAAEQPKAVASLVGPAA